MLKKSAVFILPVIIIFFAACASTDTGGDNGILLRWKLENQETIVYDTELKEVTGDYRDLIEVFESLKEGDIETADYLQNEFDNMQTIQKDSIMKTIIQNGDDGILQMTMIVGPGQRIMDDLSIIDDLTGHDSGVMLRGDVDTAGKIVSFWVKRGQKNLVAMLLELPEKRVNVGDTWSLDINFIENDQTFICSNADKKNTITLIDLKEDGGDTIAVMKYDISELVSGTFPGATFGLDTDLIEATMIMGFRGLAEFSVNEGRWLRYSGIMYTETQGFQDSTTVRKISMKPE